ncbi:MAG TPA: polysaccharide deacetylase family protein [Hyphomicrobiaceae bacterium]|nr:polysaccharide deacetylase family protein [Hyphomicrobiaceae bacterium]
MSRRSTSLFKAALSALHYSGTDSMLAPLTRGAGVIFMLHHVRPEKPDAFEPNRILKITPDFLEQVIKHVVEQGFEVVSLDELHYRMTEGDHERPFACFTFDDGYKDNREHAYPIFKRYGLPFAIYVPSDYADGRGDLWWLALERIISSVDALSLKMDGTMRKFKCATPADKDTAFHTIYWWLRGINEDYARQVVRELGNFINLVPEELCASQVMSWDEIRAIAADPLVTIGAHTRRHFALARLSISDARAEVAESVKRIERELARPCRHFSFPYGDASSAGGREFELARELGLKTAVTTRKGLIHPHHAKSLTALPRLSLNGDFQKLRYLKVMLNGAPFSLWSKVERLAKAG